MAEIELEQITKEYPGRVLALRDVTLRVESGEMLVLVGPSGCGKTTLLRLVAGLDEPTRGTVRIGGRMMNHVPPRRRDVGMVFQRPALYPHLTVRENLAFGLRLRRWRELVPGERVVEVARLLSLTDLLDRRPGQLSGGQQKRVALGRALLLQPRVLLLDEPLNDLDAPLRLEMRGELRSLHGRLATTVVHVTHDPQEALSLGDRVAVLDRGVLQQVGRPDVLYQWPINRFVAGFLGSPPMNFVEGRLEEGPIGLAFAWPGGRVALPPETARDWAEWKGRPVVLGVRAEDLVPAAVVTDFPPLQVVQVEPWGFAQLARLEGPEVRLAILARGCDFLRVGDTMRVAIPWNLSHLFDGSDGKTLGERGKVGGPDETRLRKLPGY
jgi:multiple sugar transport system ATP-binding protein